MGTNVKKNIVTEVLSKDELNTLEEMAKSHDMTLVDFGRFIAKIDKEKGFVVPVRFAVDEMEAVDKMAADLKLARSKFCEIACKWYLKENGYENLDLWVLGRFREDGAARECRINATFRDKEIYEELQSVANKLSVKLSALIRYCVLEYKGNSKVF